MTPGSAGHAGSGDRAGSRFLWLRSCGYGRGATTSRQGNGLATVVISWL